MYCWGSTENGELGLGGPEVEQVLLPKFNNFGSSWKIKQISPGLMHTLILTEDGQLYSCGNNEGGQLGHDKATRRPEHVDALEGYTIVEVAAGDQHSLALTSWGMVYSWGENGFGQLGINSLDSHADVPRLIKSLAKKQVIQLSCGANHTLALTLDGEVYTWGLNSNGQLGLGHKDSPVREPHLLKAMVGVPLRLLKAGGQHSVALSQAGFLFTWGSNKYGQLGRSLQQNFQFCSTPKIVPNLATYSEPLRYVAVGESHTTVLDAYGKLWTFGHGKYGQLGHGTFEDSSVPRPVLDLIGSKVSQVSCGRCHTIVYVPSQGQLYAFGQGMSGQLGIKTPQNRCTPQAVIGQWRSPSGRSIADTDSLQEDVLIFYVKNVFAGGDASFVTVSKEERQGPDYCVSCPHQQPLTIEESEIKKILSIACDDMIDDDLFTYCETVLGSLCCWNGSFVKDGLSKTDHCLDYRLAEESMNKLGRIVKEVLVEVVHLGIQKATKDLPSNPLSPEAMRSFLILPLWKGFSDVKNAGIFQGPYAEALLRLDVTSLVTIKRWLQTLPLDFLRLLLSHYKKIVAYIIKSQKNDVLMKQLSPTLMEERSLLLYSLKVLDFLYKENKSFPGRRGRLSYEEFYIAEIAENVDIRMDYYTWLRSGQRIGDEHGQICFCEYSYLFDSQAKTLLLRADSSRQMQGAIQNAVMTANPLMWLINPNEVQFLNIHVRRENLVPDTISEIDRHHFSDLKRPLKVHFIGEEAEDAGGVRKEFFLLLLRELLNPDYGMFTEFKETKTLWFREGALEVEDMYSLIGVVCGLAIYNFTIINLHFPLALYKKLLDEKVGIDDFTEIDPSFTKSLRQLLDYDGNDVENVFALNFTVTEDYFGETKVIPLKNSGEKIAVDAENRQEYVDLLIDWRLNKSIEKQYRSFHKGFHRVCGGGVLKLFQPMELMALVTGNENYDWHEFQSVTVYKGEYYADHPVIKIFWEVFHELTNDQKKKFLLFLTGCDRIPILGMKAIKMVIEPTSDTNYLPVAHTCTAQLDLPKYNTKEKLKYKLLMAIQQSEGFGLV